MTSGRVRYAGVSDYSGWQTAAAATWQRAWPGRSALASTQIEYSLLARGAEAEVLPAAAIALAWVRDRPGITAPVIGARTTAQLTESLTAEHLTLPDQVRAILDDVSAPA